jgi:hypothetical protein
MARPMLKKNASRCVLHIGSHRTGTTLLQEFMYRRRLTAEKHKIRFIEIDECRSHGLLSGIVFDRSTSAIHNEVAMSRLHKNLSDSLSNGWRVFLSEENISGTMEDNACNASLYPDFRAKLRRLGGSLSLFDTVYLSIRPYPDWWMSCLSYLWQRDFRINEYSNFSEQVLDSPRSWYDLVLEICEELPHAKIVVREFDYFISNPKRQIRDVTQWPEIKLIQNIPHKVSNASSKGTQQVLQGNADRTGVPVGTLFSPQQIKHLNHCYVRDLVRIDRHLKQSGKLLR